MAPNESPPPNADRERIFRIRTPLAARVGDLCVGPTTMRCVLLHFVIVVIATTIAHAEWREFEVRGTGDASPKSNRKGFAVGLVDSGSAEKLVAGLVSVPDSFGDIESAVLVVYDAEGKKLSRSVLASQRVDAKTTNFEFDLRRDLLKHSYVAVSHRAGQDLHVAKFILGSFHVRERSDKKLIR